MEGLFLIKLLLLSLAMLGAVRLLVVVFLGDCQTGPAFSRILRRPNVFSEGNAGKK
jgi:hypothetical protein